MVRDELSAGLFVGIQFVALGLIAWASATPFVFPSLGPSAYLLATGERDRASGPYHVIGGHLIAVVAGLLAYHLIAPGLVVTDAIEAATPFSADVGLLAASSVTAMVLTTIGMLVSDTNHPAACATTLIVSLGLLSTLADAVVIMVAITFLVALHELVIHPIAAAYDLEPKDPR